MARFENKALLHLQAVYVMILSFIVTLQRGHFVHATAQDLHTANTRSRQYKGLIYGMETYRARLERTDGLN